MHGYVVRQTPAGKPVAKRRGAVENLVKISDRNFRGDNMRRKIEDDETFPIPTQSSALLAQIGTQPLTSETQLEAGQTLEARWDDRWWPAQVLAVLEDGRVSIHYSGWPASYDEIVPRSRLRFSNPENKTVSVIGEGFSQTGVLVNDIDNFLVIELPSGARLFINRDKILYLEVST